MTINEREDILSELAHHTEDDYTQLRRLVYLLEEDIPDSLAQFSETLDDAIISMTNIKFLVRAFIKKHS